MFYLANVLFNNGFKEQDSCEKASAEQSERVKQELNIVFFLFLYHVG
jgi:hypothetical protein